METDKTDLEAMLKRAGIKFESTKSFTITQAPNRENDVMASFDEEGRLKQMQSVYGIAAEQRRPR